MNRPTPLRSPAALLTVLAVLLGTLAAVLALAAPAKAVTVRGTFTLQGGSGAIGDPVFATGVTTSAACPQPADPAEPYDRVELALVNPDASADWTDIAGSAAGEPLSGGPFTRELDHRVVDGQPRSSSLSEALRRYRPEGPLDGRYELRLHCRTATETNREDYFSAMVEVTGETWAPIAQRATVLEVTSDPVQAVEGGRATITATVQPADAAGSVAFQKFFNEELTDLGTVAVSGGKAETVLTDLPLAPDGIGVVATFTPADPEAHTPVFSVYTLYVTDEPLPTPTTPTPTGTTPTPTGTTPTPTDTPTGTPTDDPTDEPTDEPTPTDPPSGTPTATGTATPTPTATGTGTTGDTSGDSGSGSGSGSGGDSGSSGSGSGGSDTGSAGGSGSGSGSGTGGSGGTTTNGGTLAATGASSAASAALGSLALCLLGAAAVIEVRRRKAGARP
ncbi:hypothetical protein ABZ615_09835 [Streptomyces sp. NPDC007325]|uniref:hypothetical protein n=1 Tax=Streptomyces sp. NPDC007325 TaxID=3154588 RepID=UPI0034050D83